MTAKEKLIRLLEDNAGEHLSGEELAAKLGVTRNAVWKAVKALQDEGYQIDAVPNRGYRLAADSDVISAPGIMKYLKGGAAPEPNIEVYKNVSSTNTVLREKASAGAPAGTVVVAARQSGGRGRMGRGFYSPADTGIYISLLLRPELAAEQAVLITTMAAVAVCKAIESAANAEPEIKWVNDVFLNGKKICGILTEAAFDMESGALEYAVLGVGINAYAPAGGFPEALKDVAGYVFPARERDLRNRLAAQFLNEFFDLYARPDQREFVDEYRRRSMVTGKRISVISAGEPRQATAIAIDDDCRLRVRYDDGQEQLLSSGEISIRL